MNKNRETYGPVQDGRTVSAVRVYPEAFDLTPFFHDAEYVLKGQRRNILRGIAARLYKLGYDEASAQAVLLRANARFSSPPVDEKFILDDIAKWSQRSPYTDTGNAQLFALLHGHDIRWCEAEDQWITWNGGRWTDLGASAGWLAQQALNAIYREAEGLSAEEEIRATKWANLSASGARLNNMTGLAKTMLPCSPDDFDQDQYLLAVANGAVDLRSGRLRSARREDLMRLTSPVTFDENADCPRWSQFLREVFEPDPELIPYLQKAVGYSLTGETREHAFFFLQGKGANGKSTLAFVLQEFLGEYGATCARSMLLEKRPGAPTNDIASLRGKRLAIAQELKDGDLLDEPAIKGLTAGDPQRVRGMYKEFFEMTPRFKLWIMSNVPPAIQGVDDGIWRRLRLLPFKVSFKGREDVTLVEKLRAELPGILNWAVQGCLRWQAEGLGTSPVVTAAGDSLREDLDYMLNFIADRCIVGEGLAVKANVLYGDYKAWCAQRGEEPRTAALFGRRLLAVEGITRERSGGVRYRGIGRQAPAEEE
jgi:putative DNA primase/helicase